MTQDLRATRGIERGARVRFTFDGREIEGYEGETVAVALLAAGVLLLRRSPADRDGRGMFCAMGACQECVIEVGERRVEACRARVTSGLRVQSVGSRDEP